MQTAAAYVESKPALKRAIYAIAILGLWTLAGAISLYQIAFDIWMTAYPLVDPGPWRSRLSIHILTAIVISICWTATAIWLYRHSRSKEIAQ